MSNILAFNSSPDELQVFNFNGFELRGKLIEDEPMFVLSDVVKALGLTTAARVAERLREKGVSKTHIPTSGGNQLMTVIDEGNLYRVIMRSNSPSAEPFETWIADEVLPSIRKTGSYAAAPVLPQSYEQALEKLLETVRANNALEAKVKQDAPKVQYVDTFVHSGDLMTFRDLSNHLGVKESQIREDLVARKWIYKHTNTRWSFKRLAHVNEYQWRAYAGFKKYFRLTAAPDAPRFGNEVRQTLKVTPAGQVAIARMYGFHADGQKAVA